MPDTILEILTSFFSQHPQKKFKKGEILIQADQQPTGIFYIEEGVIRRYYLSENGDEVTLNLYKPYTFLPMSWAIANVPNTHFYEAMTDVVTRFASKESVLAFLHDQPSIVYDLLRRVYIGMEGLWMHMESLTAGTSYTKLVASLVILSKRFGVKDTTGVTIGLKMSEQEIAKYAGMSRETANRELQKLKKDGIIHFDRGTLTISDLQKLENLVLQ